MTHFGPPEQVYVENEWYDGPRAGIADIQRLPHRFTSLFDEDEVGHIGTFLIWPVDQSTFDLEVEQWRLFVEWNFRYESGQAGTDSHPGRGGIDRRWDEIQALLNDGRSVVPAGARRARADIRYLERERRYAPSGPAYMICWCVV